MINGVHLKICGLRREQDALAAAGHGADYLGFILHEKSPRHLSSADYARLVPRLPAGPRRVAVMVEPTEEALGLAHAAGFDRFQIHARHDAPSASVRAWSETVGPSRLWLAPKLPPGAAFPVDWLALAETFLFDTYHAAGFGGSGQTGDWSGFAQLTQAYPQKTWILAGGLNPENIGEARRKTRATFFDVNSGVEISSGIKSTDKLQALAHALTTSRPDA